LIGQFRHFPDVWENDKGGKRRRMAGGLLIGVRVQRGYAA
jgi:hypothetical protein